MKVLTVATRGGELAVAQTRLVVLALKRIYRDVDVRVREITTRGDSDRRTALWELKDTGFFTSLIEDSLLAGEADFAVHSYKDLPTADKDGLEIAAVMKREFPEDCLLALPRVDSIAELPCGSVIGTSSLRRMAQIVRMRPDLRPEAIRGNVPTRIRLLEKGKFDAIILARAGLERLNLAGKISVIFDPAEFIPAPAQGALAIQARTDNPEVVKMLAALDDARTRVEVTAERHILVGTGCGCHAPVGAFAQVKENDILITAFISDRQGDRFIKRCVAGNARDAVTPAERLAKELLDAGGSEILKGLES